MKHPLSRQIGQIKSALLLGDPAAALARIEDLTRSAARKGIDPDAHHLLEPAMTELRDLAEASLKGALQAAEQVRAIVQAARSLQTYDSFGRRRETRTRANLPQRF
jgi:hypothetical protein